MPNAASLSQQVSPSIQLAGNPDKEYSAVEYSSGADSDNDVVGLNGSGNTRALKRKRPLTVSYVPEGNCAVLVHMVDRI